MVDHKTIFPEVVSAAVSEVFGSVYGAPSSAPDDENLYGLEGVFSTIYLKGDLVGKMSIFIRGSYAARVVARMLDVKELDEDTLETMDGIGEILNMITGCFKQRLDQHKVKLEISVPSTRLTSVIPPSRWENVVQAVFSSGDVYFKVLLAYRMVSREEQAAQEPPPKPKLSAADLLRMAMAKKK